MLKKIKNLLFSIVLILFFFTSGDLYAGVYPFQNKSVLAQGKFVKIRIKESGVYRLTFEDLNSMGITPANVRIFGYGGAVLKQNFSEDKKDDLPEIAIHMEKGSDGVFNSGDFILFYTQGVNSWAYDVSKSMFTHVINPYSEYGYYFVTSDAGIGRKIEVESPVTLPGDAVVNQVNEFTDYAVYEKEFVNLVSSGKEFYGETFSDMLSLNIHMTFPNLVKQNNGVKVRLDVAALSGDPSNFVLTVQGGQQKTLTVSARTPNDNYEKGRAANGIYSFTPSSDLLNFNLSYTKSSTSSKGYLNYLEVNARRLMKMSDAAMRFQNIDNLGLGTYDKFNLSNTTSAHQIWDITDPVNVKRVNTTLKSDTTSFLASNLKTGVYLAINPINSNAFPKPEILEQVPAQNLHAMDFADMFIIAHPNFQQQAERLAQAHNNMGEITVSVVTTDQVYNEFSSGAPDATAYRWFLKMMYDRAIDLNDDSKRPKYLLLFGRGSFDNRKVLYTSSPSYVLTYQTENSLVETLSYVTDDYFAFLEDHEGNQVPAHTMEVGVGRFPVTNVAEATDVVTKTIGYMKNTNKGIWKNQICYLADDGDGALHMRQADSIASMIGRLNPSFQINKIFLDAYQQEVSASGETYPVARTQFHNLIRKGLFLLDYVGHAGSTGWTNEQILANADVKTLSNKNLPLWVAATCNFLQYDIPTISAGEQVLLNPVGGGIGIFSAARPVYASQNMNINKLVNQYLFLKENGKNLRVGEVFRRAKNGLNTEINKLSYVYMGDPAVRLNYPDELQVVVSGINGSTVLSGDTICALSEVTFSGKVTDQNGITVNDFNGHLHANVYDKLQRITTLNNDSSGFLIYNDRPNMLFSGTTEVKDGEFSLTFMLPKDIKYNYGTGRVNFYAYDLTSETEAQGKFENFIIGGSNENFIYESDGPQVKMYLNSEDFIPGGKVNEAPLFIAEISDINGINQIGSGIGHDLMLVVDEDPAKSYVLNDFYLSALNDYSSGVVRFKLPELRSGKHTLTFRSWDLLNNSSTHTLDFEVVKGLQPIISGIYNYPNPVKTYTNFVIEHDRPETVMNATVDIFDLSGRRVWTFNQSTLDLISWDVTDSFGKRLTNGVYLYRISIQTSEGVLSSKINKLIVID